MSKKDYGCFLCPGKTTEFSGKCTACGQSVDVGSELTNAQMGDYRTTQVLGRGFNGWTLIANDTYQDFAVKVIPRHRLKTEMADKEARALAACASHRNIARFVRPFSTAVSVFGVQVPVFCLLFEYIKGAVPLSHFCSNQIADFQKRDVASILVGIASGLARMHCVELWHDDLHDDNILVRTVNADENLGERFEAKIIDFGSTKRIVADCQEPVKSDYSYLAKHIFNVVCAFEVANAGQMAPVDRAFAARLRRLAHQLSDSNVSRRNLTPTEVVKSIRVALEESTTGDSYPSFKEMKEQTKVSFEEPLANTNAISLAPQDIALLFIDALGWKERIKKSETVLVVGPRGCGKTMLLRYLSVTSYARPQERELSPEAVAERLTQMRHVGFLVNVGQLRTPFLRSGYKELEKQDKAKAEDFCREYLNSQFVFEVLRTIIWLNAEHLIGLRRDDVSILVSTIAELLPVPPHSGSDGLPLESLAEIFDRKVVDLSNISDTSSFTPTVLSRDDVLVRLAQAIRRTQWGAKKEVWFLLDDYSVTVLPELAQKAYNPVLFRLSDSLRIKVSSEGEGPLLTDTLGRRYREGREVTKVNLGEVYFRCEEDETRRFFEEILTARFKATGRGNLETLNRLLGEHDKDKNFGEYICELNRPGDARFYGFRLLCRLCSGDVSFIIELLHSLVRGRWNDSSMKATEQDEIIKRFAQRQLAELRATSEYGDQLHRFACSMGELIKRYLLRSKGKEADERLRIEIEGSGELSIGAQGMLDALMRHSVLISGGAGKSQKGLPTRKLYFRRLFAPCFPFSPTRKGCIAVTFTEFEKWLLDPEQMLLRLDPKPTEKSKGSSSKMVKRTPGVTVEPDDSQSHLPL